MDAVQGGWAGKIRWGRGTMFTLTGSGVHTMLVALLEALTPYWPEHGKGEYARNKACAVSLRG